MGGGYYSTDMRSTRATTMGYDTKSRAEIFSQRSINTDMNPSGVRVREARDSEDHPRSIPIIMGLDVTGSMGTVPHSLVKDGLPKIMGSIIQHGTPDPQLLFIAIGDHEVDRAPLQVGQFESNDEMLDKWLTDVYLEGGGGGNAGESYLLAWYFAGYHTETDHWEKRGQKGILFTIGDEPTLRNLPATSIKSLMTTANENPMDYSAAELLEKAREHYEVYHLHIAETRAGRYESTINGWKEIMGDNVIVVQNHEDIPRIVSETVIDVLNNQGEDKEVEETSDGVSDMMSILHHDK